MTFDSTNDLIWLLDSEQRVVRSNKTAEQFFKRPGEELAGLHCWEIMHATAAPIPECPSLLAKKSLRRETTELQIGDSWFDVTVDPILDASGQYCGAVHMVRDITRNKQTELALQEAEQKFRTIFESASDGILIARVCDRTFSMANTKICEMLGYTAEELLQLGGMSDIHPEEFLPDVVNLFEGLWRKERLIARDIPVMRKDKTVFFVDINSSSIIVDGKECLLGLFRDISERKQAEEILRESAVHFRTLADSGQALIWTAGTDKKCDYFNDPWLKFTGRKLEEELGDGWTKGVHPDDLDRCLEIYTTAFDRREKFSMNYRIRHNDGEYRWIQDDGSPRYNSKGVFLGYIGHCLDITGLKQAQEKISALNDELEQRVEKRTTELKDAIAKLEKLNRVFVGRELRMAELKKRIAELEEWKT